MLTSYSLVPPARQLPLAPIVGPDQLMAAPLDYHQTMRLNTFGFVELRQRLDTQLVNEIGAAMDALFSDANAAEVEEGLWVEAPALAERLFASPAFADAAGSIVGPNFVYVRSSCLRLSADRSWRGGSGTLRWPLPHVTLLLFPRAVDETSGCMRVVPGSHQNFLRLLDSRWDQAPDYLYGLRNPNLRWQHSAFGVADQDIPSLSLTSNPGDLLVMTEEALHASFGSTRRDYLSATFMASPRDQHFYFLRELQANGGGLRPPAAMVQSAHDSVRRMTRLVSDVGPGR